MKRVSLVLLAVIIGLSACKKQAQDIAAQPPVDNFGDMLIVGSVTEPLNLIPLMATDDASKAVTALVYNGLIKQGRDLSPAGDLAESWDINEEDNSITFHLKQNITWHDGAPFTAADVLFTHEQAVSSGSPIPYDADELKVVSAISAPDDYTVLVEYDFLPATALTSWSIPVLPKHLLEDVPVTKSPLQKAPIGTGPYVFESWSFGQSIVLHANLDYFDKRPNIATVEFRYFPTQEDAYNALLAEEIDLLPLSAQEYDSYEGSYAKYRYAAPAFSYIGYNTLQRPFNEAAVREALSIAINREHLVDELFGYATLTDSPYIQGSFWHYDTAPTAYDPGKAAAILEEAGWKLNSKGQLAKGNQAMKITLITNKNPLRAKIMEHIAEDWRSLGAQVDVKIQDWGQFLGDLNRGAFDAAVVEISITQDPDLTNVWHSSMCKQPNGLNFSCYKSEQADLLLEKGASVLNIQERKIYYDELQALLQQERPGLFLYVPDSLLLAAPRIRGIDPSPYGVMQDISSWYVNKDEHKYKNDSEI